MHFCVRSRAFLRGILKGAIDIRKNTKNVMMIFIVCSYWSLSSSLVGCLLWYSSKDIVSQGRAGKAIL